jgi:hypothetical protein
VSAILWFIIWTQIAIALFAAYASFHEAQKAGRLKPIHWITYSLVLLIGYPLDVILLNTIIGSVLFLEVPWRNSWRVWEWTFTERVKRHLLNIDWRRRMAQRCQMLINALEPGHV